tara:strand:+ start:7 stop:150 length:144 start_codon:yes stop_codon:yes gene_type:complete
MKENYLHLLAEFKLLIRQEMWKRQLIHEAKDTFGKRKKPNENKQKKT